MRKEKHWQWAKSKATNNDRYGIEHWSFKIFWTKNKKKMDVKLEKLMATNNDRYGIEYWIYEEREEK